MKTSRFSEPQILAILRLRSPVKNGRITGPIMEGYRT
jgi:hypothetical protein